jgi:ABC-type transport system involved in multi-copper enzyme maturation permease subunit
VIEWLRQTVVVAIVECRLQVVSAAWRVAVVLSVILAAISTVAGVRAFERQQSEIDLLTARRAEAAEGGQHIVSGFQRDESLRIIRPITPASILVHIRESTLYQDPGPEGLSAGTVAPHQTTATTEGLGLDLEFVLRGLVGLLAVVVGASSLVTARHRGTTKALVSLPVRPAALVAGALAGGLAAIALAAAAAIAAAGAVIGLFASSMLTAPLLGTAILLWVSAVVFGAAVQGLGAIAALWSRTAAGTLSVAVAAWLIATIVAIPVVSAAASSLAPVGPRTLFEAERGAIYQDLIAGLEFTAGEIVSQELGPRAIRADVQLEGRMLAEVNDLWNTEIKNLRARLDAIEADLREGAVAQGQWMRWISLPLPGALFRSAATDLAGVGVESSWRWNRETIAYQQSLDTAVFDARPRIHFRLRWEDGVYATYFHDRAPRPTVAELPPFVPHQPTLSTRARDAAPSLALLGLHGAIAWSIAMLIFVRRQGRHGDWN